MDKFSQIHPVRLFSQACAIVLILLFIGEMCLRDRIIQNQLAPPSVGSSHLYFELHLARLDELWRETKTIDCIFVGSSQVMSGIDPAIISKELGGLCYNFGVPGMAFETGQLLAEFLYERYHPKTLVYGFSGLDFRIRSYNTLKTQIAMNPLLQHTLGKTSPEGYLLQYSKLYQYYLRYQDWDQYNFGSTLDELNLLEAKLLPFGFNNDEGFLNNSQPLPEELQGLTIDTVNIEAFFRLIEFINQHSIQAVWLEMPLHPAVLDQNGSAYLEYQNLLSEAEADYGIQVHRLSQELPDENWRDYSHVSLQGAEIVSEWAAQILREAGLG